MQYSPLENVLSKLRNVKKTGEDKYTALCPAHEDRESSLSVTRGNNGQVLLYCHAGCDANSVVSSMGLQMRDLYPQKEESSLPSKKRREIIAIYDYVDKEGTLLYQVCRTFPKSFFQRRPDGRGGYISGLGGVKPVLYKLPRILKAIEKGLPVFIAEGEKDVNNLTEFGLAATTNPMGAGGAKWHSHFNDYLIGANVVILPDNDKPGIEHANNVAQNLWGKAVSIKILNLPDLPPKGDVTDWIAAGGNRDKLLELVSQAPYWEPPKEAPESKDSNKKTVTGNPFRMSDMGNAERLVEKEGSNIHWNATKKTWEFWDGRRWDTDTKGHIIKCMKRTVRSIYLEAADIEDYNVRMALVDFARRSESHNKIIAAIKLSQSELALTHDELDRNPWYLNCLNGTINLKNGELQPHRRQDLITKLAPVNYEGIEVTHPLWDKFLNRIIPDQALRDFIQRAVGYSVTGLGTEEKLFFAWGEPLTGKTTFLNAISSALGDYAATADFNSFIDGDKSGGPRNDIARLAGKRFVQSIEVGEGKKLAEGLVKTITGGDVVTARFLYTESFEFLPTFKLWLAANSRPRVREDDAAMWRRILQIPFDQRIPENERDPHIKEALRDPAIAGAAIMAWMVKGCLMWQKEGLKVPEVVKRTTEEYRMEMDPIKDFIDECCMINPLAKVKVSDLRKAYENWCLEYGEKYPVNAPRFKRSLEGRGLIQFRTGQHRMWQGIGLVDNKRAYGYPDLSGIVYRDNGSEPYPLRDDPNAY